MKLWLCDVLFFFGGFDPFETILDHNVTPKQSFPPPPVTYGMNSKETKLRVAKGLLFIIIIYSKFSLTNKVTVAILKPIFCYSFGKFPCTLLFL